MSQTKDASKSVEDEPSFGPLVDATDVTVKSLNEGVAANGPCPSYAKYVDAPAAAGRVAEVKTVHNHLEVVLPPGDCRDDATLTTIADDAMTLGITIPDGVEATPSDANILLGGTVRLGSQPTAAESAEAGLTRVIDVMVDKTGNTVTRIGHVRIRAEYHAAMNAAWTAYGVYDVHDDRCITG